MKQRVLERVKDRLIVQSVSKITQFLAVGFFVLSLIATLPGRAATAQPTTFSTPEAATQAMVDALRKDDRPELLTIFGKDSKGLLISGDPVSDRNSIESFLKEYDQMHRFERGFGGRLYLIVGAVNWPMPIPLVKTSQGWSFDTPYGKQEFLFERIGENEFSAIRILDAIVKAEHEYYDQAGDKTKEFAQKIVSDPDTHNGLYWKTADGGPESPIGPLVAKASLEGYHLKSGKPAPVRGYYFKLLAKQGKDAPGGAMDYVADGKMTGGFAVVAYPSSYRSSGVMTFLAGPNGQVYEKDLGPHTASIASSIVEFDPDPSWYRFGEDKGS
jgi:hypothetical protein